jgi:hypothetical protein
MDLVVGYSKTVPIFVNITVQFPLCGKDKFFHRKEGLFG